ncbi:MAG: hypothetical protein K9G29_10040 [Crocinitomicaceae bacterium]|nr:hypothetical protein [Crocinitomicaceae bacterium]
MKIKKITFEIPGITPELLKTLTDESSINLLSAYYKFKKELLVYIEFEDYDKKFEDIVKKVSNNTKLGITNLRDITNFGHDTSIRSYRLQGGDIDFRKIANLYSLQDNLAMIVMLMRSDDYYEYMISNIILACNEYL